MRFSKASSARPAFQVSSFSTSWTVTYPCTLNHPKPQVLAVMTEKLHINTVELATVVGYTYVSATIHVTT